MAVDYQQIVELFGLVIPEPDFSEEPEEELRGRSAAESQAIGDQLLREGDFANAAKHFLRALDQADGDPAESHLGLGVAYECMDASPAAFRQYREALKLQQSAEPYLGLSDILRRHGRQRDAIERLQQAIRLEPANPYFHLKLAEALRDMGYRKRALIAIQQAIVIQPDDAFYHFYAGDLALEMGEHEVALACLRAAIELSPGDDKLFAKASCAFWGAGKRTEAIKAIRLASDLNPDNNMYYGLLQRFLIESGDGELSKLESTRAGAMDNYDREKLVRYLKDAGFEPS